MEVERDVGVVGAALVPAGGDSVGLACGSGAEGVAIMGKPNMKIEARIAKALRGQKVKPLTTSWEEMLDDAAGTLYEDIQEDGVRLIVVRGPASVNAYVGVPKSHPLADHGYDDLPLECHGGLTFAQLGKELPWDKDWYWYGWDYAHSGDCSGFTNAAARKIVGREEGTKWTPKMVSEDAWGAVYEFKKLARLAEKISNAKR